MKILAPTALIFSALAIPILLLYMLKLRRREVPVSSTLLWQRLLRDRQANAPWQRLKRSLLLFLQLLTLAALVFALARPAMIVPSLVSSSVVIVLDGSASMNATDGKPASGASTRFEAAREIAHHLVDELPGGGRMTLVLAGQQAQILSSNSSSPSELHAALDRAQPSQGASDWQAAFSLAAAAAASGLRASGENAGGGSQAEPVVILISDGGLPQDLPGLPAQVRYVQVGRESDNLAVAALALRPAGQGAELFARVANYGATERTAILSFYVDGDLFSARQLRLPAGGSSSQVISELPPGSVYSARLAPAEGAGPALDALPLDDTAYAVFPYAGSGRTLLVTPGNIFLEQLLAALPNISPARALADSSGKLELPVAGQPGEHFDLYIFDNWLPNELPQGNLLLVNPPDNPLFQVQGVFTDTFPAQVLPHPLTRYVDWSSVNVRQARRVQTPDWADSLVSAPGGPLVFAGETAGRRVAVLTFDLHDSDLPLQVVFPVLLSNLINYLVEAPGLPSLASGESLRPGDSIQFPLGAGITRLDITSPSGQGYVLQPDETGAAFSGTSELGVYRVAVQGEIQESGAFAVNLFEPGESAIQPAGMVQIGRTAVLASTQTEVGQRELWQLLALAALVVLMLEWWVYHRRQLLPARLAH